MEERKSKAHPRYKLLNLDATHYTHGFPFREELTALHTRTISKEVVPLTKPWPVAGYLDKLLYSLKQAKGIFPYVQRYKCILMVMF